MDIFNYLDKLNWQTIIAMFVIGWYFTKDFREDMKTLNNSINKLDADIRQQGQRTDKLYEMFIDLLKETRK